MNCEEGKTVEEQSTDTELKLGPPGPPFGIVINGSSLVSKELNSVYDFVHTIFCFVLVAASCSKNGRHFTGNC